MAELAADAATSVAAVALHEVKQTAARRELRGRGPPAQPHAGAAGSSGGAFFLPAALGRGRSGALGGRLRFVASESGAMASEQEDERECGDAGWTLSATKDRT